MSARCVLGAPLFVVVLATAAPGQQPARGASKPGVPKAAPRAPVVVVKRDNPCSVLLPGEVEQVLGTPITMREIMDEVTCHFDYDKPQPGLPPYFEMKVYQGEVHGFMVVNGSLSTSFAARNAYREMADFFDRTLG